MSVRAVIVSHLYADPAFRGKLRALAGQGAEMRVMLPGYPGVLAALDDAGVARRYKRLFGAPARLLASHFYDVMMYILYSLACYR